jgi:hypothetical protein
VTRPRLEVADVFRRFGPAWRAASEGHLSPAQRRVMGAVELCRTAALGGHVERCADCAHTRVAYNSCRNRHCPKCQWRAAQAWLAAREAELLPVPYFHVVFTLPAAVQAGTPNPHSGSSSAAPCNKIFKMPLPTEEASHGRRPGRLKNLIIVRHTLYLLSRYLPACSFLLCGCPLTVVHREPNCRLLRIGPGYAVARSWWDEDYASVLGALGASWTR